MGAAWGWGAGGGRLLAHDEVELGWADAARAIAELAVARDGPEVGVCHVQLRLERLPHPQWPAPPRQPVRIGARLGCMGWSDARQRVGGEPCVSRLPGSQAPPTLPASEGSLADTVARQWPCGGSALTAAAVPLLPVQRWPPLRQLFLRSGEWRSFAVETSAARRLPSLSAAGAGLLAPCFPRVPQPAARPALPPPRVRSSD